MEYPQGSFQDMIEKYNRELMEAYRRQSPPIDEATPSTDETVDAAAEVAEVPPVIPFRVIELSPEEDEDTRPRYPTYDSPPAAPVIETAAEAVDPAQAPPDEVGYLQIWVTTATSALPIEGAHVTVSRNVSGKAGEEATFVGVTDENGRTPAFPLPAASPQLSLTPDGTITPYTLYNIEVYADGFYRVKNLGLPLYGGVRALQPVRLIPLPEYGGAGDTLTFLDSAPQNLSGEGVEE